MKIIMEISWKSLEMFHNRYKIILTLQMFDPNPNYPLYYFVLLTKIIDFYSKNETFRV